MKTSVETSPDVPIGPDMILFLDQFASLGGGQRILIDVVRATPGEKLLMLPDRGEVSERLAGVPLQVEPVPVLSNNRKTALDAVRYLRGSLRLAAAIRAAKPDLVFVNGPRCLLGAALARIPFFAAVHLVHKGVELKLMSWCFKRPNARKVVFCSEAAQASFGMGEVIENWVSPDVEKAPPRRDEWRKRLGLTDEVAVGIVGRLSPNKGQAQYAAQVADLNVRLFLAGAADHEEPEAADYGKAEKVGKIEDVAGFLDAMDILAIPSVTEAFGLAAVEAMSRGLPVIATPVGGLPSVVDHEVTGLVVDPAHLGEATQRLAADPALRKRMGEAGLAKVRRQYTSDLRLPHLVDEMLADSRRAV